MAAALPQIAGPDRSLPVYSLREPGQRAAAARALARGRVGLFYLGLFTVVKALRPPWAEGDGAEVFWRVKPDRPRWSKLPMILRPQDSLRLLDAARLHPALRGLARRERWAALWESHGAPLHVIAPLREPLPFLHPAFRTTPADLASQAAARLGDADRLLPATTASFFWMDDPAWHDFGAALGRASLPRTFFGGTSFNAHGEQPPYTLDELAAYVRRRDTREADLVIADPELEAAGIFSSHTMVRLPLADEPPELVVTRLGSLPPAVLAAASGLPVRVLASVASASRRPGLGEEALAGRLAAFCARRRGGRA